MADITDTQLAEADRAAEELAKSQREPFNRELDPQRESALDDAFAAATQNQPPAQDVEHGRENGGVQTPIEGAPKDDPASRALADQAAAEKLAADVASGAPKEGEPPAPKADETPAPAKGLLEDLVAAKPADPAPAADPYDVKLRSDASPKTRETFDQLKQIAKQREDAAVTRANEAQAKIDELAKQVEELTKRTVPDDVKTELAELRQFRAQFDTQNDPEFRQKFDTRLNANYDAIYSKLAAHGLPATEIEKLKAFSQSERDEVIDGFLTKLPPMERKFIEAKLLNNINVLDERENALREVRAKADQILAERKNAPVQEVAKRDGAVASILKPAIEKLPWLHIQQVPPNAPPEERKKLEASNLFASSMQDALRRAIVDDSPATRAEAAIAVPLAHHYRQVAASEKARADALQAKLSAIQNASQTSRTARSSASSQPPAAKPAENQSPSEALDDLFTTVTGR